MLLKKSPAKTLTHQMVQIGVGWGGGGGWVSQAFLFNNGAAKTIELFFLQKRPALDRNSLKKYFFFSALNCLWEFWQIHAGSKVFDKT